MLNTFKFARTIKLLAILIVTCPALLCSTASAQTRKLNPNVNYLLSADQPPGYVASAQIARGMPGVGAFQPVAIRGPEGLKVALAQDGMFLDNIPAPVTTAMMVGATYRFRVANIPFRPGAEVYPTVEVIDRLYAPQGREHRFPIPIVLTRDDIELALQGALVTRVIYLEDSEIAAPIQAHPDQQTVTNVTADENALQTADQLGRPVAILRIGSRVPSADATDLMGFMYGCPPWMPLMPVPDRDTLTREHNWPAVAPVVSAEDIRSEPPTEESPRLPDAR